MKYFLFAVLMLVLLPCSHADWKEKHPEWVAVVDDDFLKGSLDPKVWSRVEMTKKKVPDWMRYQSEDAGLVCIKDGMATLWGRYGCYKSQDDQEGRNPTYACGGFYTDLKVAFQYGYVEVRAKFDSVQGVWPAIWLKTNSHGPLGFPAKGEIDIMEHLNAEDHVYQTLHYWKEKGNHHLTRSSAAPIDKDDFNTYGVLWEEGRITFFVNGQKTVTYEKQGKCWPFDEEGNELFLVVDQQIGGSWVEGIGKKGIDKETLSTKGAAFIIDYVRVYTDPKYAPKARPAN